MMTSWHGLVAFGLVATCFIEQVDAAEAVSEAATGSRPNVVVIFIDDLGYGDVGFNGATGPKTPNLDRMAAEGTRFDHFYVGCAVCSGSRTSLLTGCHYQRLSMNAVLFPHSDRGLHPDEVTVAEMLRDAGYRTACVGKWHLGHLPPCLPTYQGFESYFGIPYSNDMWRDPANRMREDAKLREGVTWEAIKAGHKQRNAVPLMRGEQIVEYPADQATLTKRYTEESIDFIRAHRDEPFFLYLPHTMVHLPLAVSEAFENQTDRLIWDAIQEVDWSVGQILQTLREEGIAEKTLVLFTSDNGAAVGSSLPLRAKKASVYDGGIREPTVMWWPGTIPAGKVCREVAATIDVLPTLARLCGAALPARKIDGRDITPLLVGEPDAKSPHEAYALMHGPGTVRSGPWKFYPWREQAGGRDGAVGRPPSPQPVQLYNVVEDISEQRNVAAEHPDLVKRLQATYDAHVAEIQAERRPTMQMERPADVAAGPGLQRRRPLGKPIAWKNVNVGDVFGSGRAPRVAGKPFWIEATIAGDAPEGVIVAHGGSVVGYSLYVQAGDVVFAVRSSDQQVTRVRTPFPAQNAAGAIVAKLTGDAKLTLRVGSGTPVTAPVPGKLDRHPAESLCIGGDDANPVDPKAPAGPFAGEIKSLTVRVGPAK